MSDDVSHVCQDSRPRNSWHCNQACKNDSGFVAFVCSAMANFLRPRIPRRWILFSLFIFSCISFYFFSTQRMPATTRKGLQPADPYSTIPAPPPVPFVLSNRNSKPSKPNNHIKALEKAYSQVAHFTAPKYRPACALLPTLARDPRFVELQQESPSSKPKTIYLALNLINNQQVLPNFFHELSTLITYLHNYRFYISILENGSSDLTPGLLVLLSQILDTLGVVYEVCVLISDSNTEKHA